MDKINEKLMLLKKQNKIKKKYIETKLVFFPPKRWFHLTRFFCILGLQAFAKDMNEKGVRLITIINPGVKADRNDKLFQEGREQNIFCKLPDGEPVIASVWPGECAFPDFTNPQARHWWSCGAVTSVELFSLFNCAPLSCLIRCRVERVFPLRVSSAVCTPIAQA